jgi:hypothetical protein
VGQDQQPPGKRPLLHEEPGDQALVKGALVQTRQLLQAKLIRLQLSTGQLHQSWMTPSQLVQALTGGCEPCCGGAGRAGLERTLLSEQTADLFGRPRGERDRDNLMLAPIPERLVPVRLYIEGSDCDENL